MNVMNSRTGRSRQVLLAGALALVTGASACGGSGDPPSEPPPAVSSPSAAGTGDASTSPEVSEAEISLSAESGEKNVSVNGLDVRVRNGELTEVSLTRTAEGTPVAGEYTAGRTVWKPAAPLERGTVYLISVTAEDAAGRESNENSKFSTLSPADSFIGHYAFNDGDVLGTGMPVSINFDKAVTDKKAVESAIKVTSTGGERIAAHWFGSERLDFRPEDYWAKGSEVTLDMSLDGVEGAEGVFGIQERKVSFTTARSQISTVDVRTGEMTVVRDGRKIKTFQVSAGSAETPTYNGAMVISEKYVETRMDGSTVGFGGEYDIEDVPHAIRLTTSGTFIHGNYWSPSSVFGNENVSHGCIGLQDVQGAGDPTTDAAWFYDNSLIGDVVVVKNSPDETVAPENGLNGWNMPWARWVAGSAFGA